MWSRVVEIMLGHWLLISPFIFRHPVQETAWWINDMACGVTVIVLGLLSFWRPTRNAHLLMLPIGCWLILVGFLWSAHPAPPALQNDVLLGLLLLMFAIIPNQASLPPEGWREQVPLQERAD